MGGTVTELAGQSNAHPLRGGRSLEIGHVMLIGERAYLSVGAACVD